MLLSALTSVSPDPLKINRWELKHSGYLNYSRGKRQYYLMEKPANSQGNEDQKRKTKDYSLVEVVSQFVDENKQRISVCLYGVMGAGVLLAFRSLRLSHQFKSVRELPLDFIKKNFNIFGIVGRTEIAQRENGLLPYLYVSHVPILGKINKNIEAQIAVRVVGVNINQNQYLASKSLLDNLTDSKVKVKLLDKSDDKELLGQVFIKKYGLWRDCVGQTLIRRGLGEYSSADMKNTIFNRNILKYETQLINQERYARRKKIGMWEEDPGEAKATSVIDKILKLLRLK